MGLFSKPSMVALLNQEQSALDRIFGKEAYEITSSHPQQATIRSRLVDVSFGCEHDGDVGSLIELRDPPAEVGGAAGTWLWATFLDVDMPPWERDRAGRVRTPPEQQLGRELAVIARLAAEVFSDPQRLREAAWYVEGRTREYNDRCSGRAGDEGDQG